MAAGILPADLVAAVSDDAARYEAELRPGILDAPETASPTSTRAPRIAAQPPRAQIAAITRDIDEFQERHGLARVVVVFVASVEGEISRQDAWDSAAASRPPSTPRRPARFADVRLRRHRERAALRELHAEPRRVGAGPAELAEERGVLAAGNDGKTGETLVKTVLAPMFRARALRVLAWQGYNMLGNRDGEARNFAQ